MCQNEYLWSKGLRHNNRLILKKKDKVECILKKKDKVECILKKKDKVECTQFFHSKKTKWTVHNSSIVNNLICIVNNLISEISQKGAYPFITE